ncbi:MAG TPA: glycerophosphodiester phosphodiesterase family protein [Allosphingosinicella sp.]|nr:glycerophosphodiester phosphodiesterase family protein [Allosphingosinicella sp.]
MPSSPSRQSDLTRLIARPFAHRGLHGPAAPENSRAAFEAAIAAGHGIELDVQASADGEAIVFHDYELERLAEGCGAVRTLGAAELGRIRLKRSDETIPTLPEVLALITGRAPLLIEVKAPGRRAAQLNRSVAAALSGYRGPVAVMSFNPEVPRWFARNAPALLRGLVVTEQEKGVRGLWERPFALWRAKPDFLAYDIRDLPSRFAAASALPVLTWTVRGAADRARAAEHADQIIYEAEPR